MWTRLDNYDQHRLISATQAYCGGVAVSCHPHLTKYWERAALLYWENEVKLNFHIIISDKKSIDSFIDIYDTWKEKVDYFVLLPHSAQGRAIEKEIDWEYLVEQIDKDSKQIAFGANFYPYLLGGDLRSMNISMYEPEILSKYITLEGTGKMYNSSFSDKVIKEDLFSNE